MKDGPDQPRTLRSPEMLAFLNLQKTADALMRDVTALLKETDLSPTQYNVLRILRAAGPDGMACQKIAGHMITRDPDMTRLLDRLEKRNLVERHRHPTDRRVIRSKITPAGLAVLTEIDEPMYRVHRLQLGHMRRDRLNLLAELLDEARRTPNSNENSTEVISHD